MRSILEAKKFVKLLVIMLTAVACSLSELEPCKELINRRELLHDNSFVSNFFQSINIKNENVDDFVDEFNLTVLKLHVRLKSFGIFVPTSPIPLPARPPCDCKEAQFIECDGSSQCDNCGVITRNRVAVAWTDVSRVHVTPTYSYDRKGQFREWLLNYQSNSATKISDISNIVLPNAPLSKTEFLYYLKLSVSDRSTLDKVHGLYYDLMNIKPPNLSQYENLMIIDFDKFSDTYSELAGKKPTIIPNQYLAYQFLNRYGYKVSKDDVLLGNFKPDKYCIKAMILNGWEICD